MAFNELNKLGVKSYILTSEINKVVSARANKLNIPALTGVANKVEALQDLSVKEGLDLSRVFYIGNDLNDFQAMKMCGLSACPADSHPKIKEIATFKLNTNGGMGIVRELLEEIFNVDVVKIIYTN